MVLLVTALAASIRVVIRLAARMKELSMDHIHIPMARKFHTQPEMRLNYRLTSNELVPFA